MAWFCRPLYILEKPISPCQPPKVRFCSPYPLPKIKGPQNPASQLLPIMSNKCCSGTGKEGKTKEALKDRQVKKVVCDKVVCERCCVSKEHGVWQSCVWKMVCVKVVCESCVKVVCERECVTKLCVRAHIRHKYAPVFCLHRQRQLRRTRFFPRWVKTIVQVPGSTASDMQQCGNSEAIRTEINNQIMRWGAVCCAR